MADGWDNEWPNLEAADNDDARAADLTATNDEDPKARSRTSQLLGIVATLAGQLQASSNKATLTEAQGAQLAQALGAAFEQQTSGRSEAAERDLIARLTHKADAWWKLGSGGGRSVIYVECVPASGGKYRLRLSYVTPETAVKRSIDSVETQTHATDMLAAGVATPRPGTNAAAGVVFINPVYGFAGTYFALSELLALAGVRAPDAPVTDRLAPVDVGNVLLNNGVLSAAQFDGLRIVRSNIQLATSSAGERQPFFVAATHMLGALRGVSGVARLRGTAKRLSKLVQLVQCRVNQRANEVCTTPLFANLRTHAYVIATEDNPAAPGVLTLASAPKITNSRKRLPDSNFLLLKVRDGDPRQTAFAAPRVAALLKRATGTDYGILISHIKSVVLNDAGDAYPRTAQVHLVPLSRVDGAKNFTFTNAAGTTLIVPRSATLDALVQLRLVLAYMKRMTDANPAGAGDIPRDARHYLDFDVNEVARKFDFKLPNACKVTRMRPQTFLGEPTGPYVGLYHPAIQQHSPFRHPLQVAGA